MASKLVGVLDAISQQITIARTDGTPDGPDTFSVNDGAYFALDLGTARVSGAGSGTVIPFASGHPFVGGQTISARSAIGGAPSAWGPVLISSVTATSVTVATSVTHAINDEAYVSDDLIGHINAMVHNQATIPNYYGLTLSLSLGIAIWTADPTESYAVSYDTADIERWFRFGEGVGSFIGVSSTGTSAGRQMEGMLYLEKDIQRDKLVLEPRASQSRSVTGQIETLYRAALRIRAIRIRTQGPPRSTTKTTYQAAEDLWSSHFDLLARGYDNYLDATIPAQVYVP
jgi:hypothetical protein